MQCALQEQLRARTAEAQSLKEESARLRSALVDAEMELQRVTSAHIAKEAANQVRGALARSHTLHCD